MNRGTIGHEAVIKYRPEIDGLRAVSVVAVILFHAGFGSFGGGFLGVDVFFVLSGYLITSIILSDLQKGQYSLANFYERRARRILPALFLVLISCAIFAVFWMPPTELLEFSRALSSVVIFSSNIYFWRSTDYFSVAAELNPLLHTWSLAVEEQFYIFYPIVLVFLARYGRSVLVISIAALLFCSFALNLIALSSERISTLAVFYLTPFRGWELLVGAICAFGRPRVAKGLAALLSTIGLLAIITSFVIFDSLTPSPSQYTLMPVIGTAFIILFCSSTDIVGRLLASRPMVGIGLISYSAYLWHQPVFSFARIRLLDEPSDSMMLALSVFSLLLAWLTWKFVENPIRFGRPFGLQNARRVLGASLMGGTVILGIGLVGVATQGFPKRFPPGLIAGLEGQRNPYQQNCLHGSSVVDEHPRSGCIDFLVNGRADVVFIGDSHADAIAFPAQKSLLAQGIGSYAVFYYTCPPFSGLSLRPFIQGHRCNEYNLEMLYYARELGARTLVLSGRYAQYLDGGLFDNGEGGIEDRPVEMVDVASSTSMDAVPGDRNRMARVEQQMQRALNELIDEFNVVIIYPVPEVGWDVPRRLLHREFYGNRSIPYPLTTDYSAYVTRNARAIEILDSSESDNIRRVKPSLYLCNTSSAGRCNTEIESQTYYFDDDHLSLAGAELLAPSIVAAVRSFK